LEPTFQGITSDQRGTDRFCSRSRRSSEITSDVYCWAGFWWKWRGFGPQKASCVLGVGLIRTASMVPFREHAREIRMRPAGCAAELPSSLLNGGSDNATLSRQRAKTVSSAVRIFLVAVLASLNSQPKKRKLMNYLFGYKVFAQGQNLSGRDERPQRTLSTPRERTFLRLIFSARPCGHCHAIDAQLVCRLPVTLLGILSVPAQRFYNFFWAHRARFLGKIRAIVDFFRKQ
jgi:hypothetical protein